MLSQVSDVVPRRRGPATAAADTALRVAGEDGHVNHHVADGLRATSAGLPHANDGQLRFLSSPGKAEGRRSRHSLTVFRAIAAAVAVVAVVGVPFVPAATVEVMVVQSTG